MKLSDAVRDTVECYGDVVSTDSYLGRICLREGGLNQISPMSNWRITRSEYLPPGLRDSRIYLPAEFEEVARAMMLTPLRRAGMVDDPDANMRFLQCEVMGWLGLNSGDDFTYDEMWSDVKNVAKYRETAAAAVPSLVEKVPALLSTTLCSASRSFELRFPPGYCPLSWGFYIDSGKEWGSLLKLRPYLIFRSVEVSRNLLNDLYLFMVYFGYILGKGVTAELPPFSIPVSSIHFFAIDAHVVDFNT